MNLADIKLHFLDLQTTGSSPAAGAILEIAYCYGSASSDRPDDVYSWLIAQSGDVPRRIKALTGITDADMQEAVPLNDAYSSLSQRVATHTDAAIVIHFAQFEKPFLAEYLPELATASNVICTHKIATKLFPNLPSRGIRGLAGFFGNQVEECKRATSHVLATFAIWKGLCKELAMRGVSTFEELELWLAQTQTVKRTKYEYPLDSKLRLELPDSPGVYRMLSRNGDVLYVGKATSLHSRVNSYFRGQKGRDPRKLEMLTQAWNLDVTVCESVVEACVLEVDEIKRLVPPYNIALKIEDRALVFYDHEFSRASFGQCEKQVVGPFRSDLVMEPFVLFWHAMSTGDFSVPIFFDEFPPEVLAIGFAAWSERHSISANSFTAARSLLAFALQRYRKAKKDKAQQKEVALAESTIDYETDARAEQSEVIELTPDDIADKFDRLLLRSANAYLLARRLTRLLNCDVHFLEGKRHCKVQVRDGKIVRSDEEHSITTRTWESLSLATFDRLRVLDTEISRMRQEGVKVQIIRL